MSTETTPTLVQRPGYTTARQKLTEVQQRRIEIWWSMTPEERDYDRIVARRIPYGLPAGEASRVETEDGREALRQRSRDLDDADYEPECTCHINPPCSKCMEGEL